MRRVYCICILCFFLLTASRPYAAHAQSNDAGWLLTQINCLRQSRGVGPLTLNPSLTTSANQQSAYLSSGRVSDMHVQPDGSTPLSRATAAGFQGYVGENVASGSAKRVLNWWIGDGIHYRNMVNPYWSEVGIGIASGANGTWYTTDFGAKAWKPNFVTPSACGDFKTPPPPPTSSAPKNAAKNAPADNKVDNKPAAPVQPAYVAGVDERGNIKHEIQKGDTLGRIALIYGYTWGNLPAMLALNNMTEADFRKLQIGAIFLVPSKSGTYTPTPEKVDPTATVVPETPTAIANIEIPDSVIADTAIPDSAVTAAATATSAITPSVTATSTPPAVAAASTATTALSTLTPTTQTIEVTSVSILPAPTLEAAFVSRDESVHPIRGLIPWAILLQGFVLGGLFIGSFVRRRR